MAASVHACLSGETPKGSGVLAGSQDVGEKVSEDSRDCGSWKTLETRPAPRLFDRYVRIYFQLLLNARSGPCCCSVVCRVITGLERKMEGQIRKSLCTFSSRFNFLFCKLS